MIPLISIVIPTKDRYETLRVLLEHFRSRQENNFEVVVQDNSSRSDTQSEFAKQLPPDPRIRYFYNDAELCAVENCDLAIGNALGEYIILIGDDDGVSMKLLLAAQWMKEAGVDAMYFQVAGYTWPDMQHAVAINNRLNGVLVYSAYHGEITPVEVRKEIQKVFRRGGQDLFRAPRVYQGLVSRKILNMVHQELGTYFPGPVPDMSNAVAISQYIDQFCYCDFPLVVSGVSKKSMSGKNAVREHQGRIDQEKSLPGSTLSNWNPRVPMYWSAPTIWAETATKAATKTGQSQLLSEFCYEWVYASCFAYTRREYFPSVFRAMSKAGWMTMCFRLPTIALLFTQICFRRGRVLLGKVISKKQAHHFSDISKAMVHLEDQLESCQIVEAVFKSDRPTKGAIS